MTKDLISTSSSAIAKPAGLIQFAGFPNMRALLWDGNVLYASCGYQLLRAHVAPDAPIEWTHVARFRPPKWRNWSSATHLTSRLFRDGFHALATLPSSDMVAAVPGAIVTLPAGSDEFRLSHRITRGTRPLHFCSAPDGTLFWGEYFDNPGRDEVHIYASTDRGATWDVAYTFPKGSVRHVHNIVYDCWNQCLWIFTGDNGAECRVIRASCDLRTADIVLSGTQQVRTVAAIPDEQGLYFSSDTPAEQNHIFRMDWQGTLMEIAPLSSSSIYGCRVGEAMFFSTMVEPSAVNHDRHVRLYGTLDGTTWRGLFAWEKDLWPFRSFQYGNAFLPDGENRSGVLAVTTVAVKNANMHMGLWRL